MATVHKWADGPFALIETPEYRLKTKSSDEYVRGASIMVLAHNVILRGLNAIYLQAPHVKHQDIPDFLAFCRCWYMYIDAHHRAEETHFFPRLEEACGEKGLMDTNVQQHQAFEAGLQAFNQYILSISTTTPFSPPTLLTMIDTFAPALCTHLSDEIPTLLSLSRFSPSLPFTQISHAEMKKTVDGLPKMEALPFFFLNLDRTFEGGLWWDWPPIPWLVRWVLVRVVASRHAGWWRFASCDYDGRPRALYALEGDVA